MRCPGPDESFERAAFAGGARRIAGIDEVGRGPLAGPVMAAAVILRPGAVPDGLGDSKRLSPARRRALAAMLRQDAVWALGAAAPAEIDALNVERASHLAMRRAVAALPLRPDHLLVDGNRLPRWLPCAAQCITGGDGRALSIAAASIIAKVARDGLMADLAAAHPGYGWERNAGYPTAEHRRALLDMGPTPHHRRSFGSLRNILYQEN